LNSSKITPPDIVAAYPPETTPQTIDCFNSGYLPDLICLAREAIIPPTKLSPHPTVSLSLVSLLNSTR